MYGKMQHYSFLCISVLIGVFLFIMPIPKLAGPEVFIFFVQLIALLGLAKILGELAKKWKQPAVLGEIAAGILLGPTILGTLFPDLFQWLFVTAPGGSVALDGLVVLSSLFLLFTVGLEIDIKTIVKEKGVVLATSALGIVLPLVVGGAVGWLLYARADSQMSQGLFAFFIGAAFSISALPVVAKILLDMDILRTRIGTLILAISAVNDIAGWLLFTLVLSLSGVAAAHMSIGATVLITLFLSISALTWLRPLLESVLRWVARVFNPKGAVFGIAILFMMMFSLLTEYIGIHAVFGAFLLGVALASSEYFTHTMRETVETMTGNFFAPLFFATVGLKANFLNGFDFILVFVVFVAAFASKYYAGILGGKMARLPSREGRAIGLGIAARGGMGIILALIAFNAKLIGPVVFEALIITALLTSMLAAGIKSTLTEEKLRSNGNKNNFQRIVGFISGRFGTNSLDVK
jgi:Kef-type K+ transport system membrane component KefB